MNTRKNKQNSVYLVTNSLTVVKLHRVLWVEIYTFALKITARKREKNKQKLVYFFWSLDHNQCMSFNLSGTL